MKPRGISIRAAALVLGMMRCLLALLLVSCASSQRVVDQQANASPQQLVVDVFCATDNIGYQTVTGTGDIVSLPTASELLAAIDEPTVFEAAANAIAPVPQPSARCIEGALSDAENAAIFDTQGQCAAPRDAERCAGKKAWDCFSCWTGSSSELSIDSVGIAPDGETAIVVVTVLGYHGAVRIAFSERRTASGWAVAHVAKLWVGCT